MTNSAKAREFFDRNGRKIEPGDVVKVFHFTGARRKKYFMYKIAFLYDGYLRFAHAHKVLNEGFTIDNSYDARVMDQNDYEIVEGYHNGHFEDRKTLKELGELTGEGV